MAYFWKKNHIDTVIEYDDGYDIQKIALDFEKGASYAEHIYKKMLECRKTAESKKPNRDTSSHPPIRFYDALDKERKEGKLTKPPIRIIPMNKG